jgi:hypothetical protein
MLILWITGKNRGQPPAVDAAKEAFRKHDEAVKTFRRTHPDLNIVSARDIVLADGDLLAPVSSVKLDGHAQN